MGTWHDHVSLPREKHGWPLRLAFESNSLAIIIPRDHRAKAGSRLGAAATASPARLPLLLLECATHRVVSTFPVLGLTSSALVWCTVSPYS